MPTVSNRRVAASWASPGKVGAPDFERLIYKGDVSHRVVLSYNEAVVRLALLASAVASTWPHRVAPLASGVETHVIDCATGLPTPWTCPVGYTWTALSYWWAFDQPCIGRLYMDGQLGSSLHENAYDTHYEHDIFEDYFAIDPTGVFPHTLDFTFINDGVADMSGYFMWMGKLITTATPPYPALKEVKCSHCGFLHKVDRKLGRVKCPDCKGETTYFPILFGDEFNKLRRAY